MPEDDLVHISSLALTATVARWHLATNKYNYYEHLYHFSCSYHYCSLNYAMVELIKDQINATKAQCALYTILFTEVVRVLSQVTGRMRANQGDLTSK